MLEHKNSPKNHTSALVSAIKLSFKVLVALLIINGCGGGNKSAQPAEDTTAKGSSYTPAAPSAPYDASKIDPSAPVMDVKLDAVGNTMDVMSFSMPEIKVKAGTTVKIHFNNTATDAAMKHNFFIVKSGTIEQVATTALSAGPDKNYIPDDKTNILFTSKVLDPGQSEDLTFPAPPVGVYQFVCTYPGHWQKMNGKFTVE